MSCVAVKVGRRAVTAQGSMPMTIMKQAVSCSHSALEILMRNPGHAVLVAGCHCFIGACTHNICDVMQLQGSKHHVSVIHSTGWTAFVRNAYDLLLT